MLKQRAALLRVFAAPAMALFVSGLMGSTAVAQDHDCYKLAPSSGEISTNCESLATNIDAVRWESGIAYSNAARAHLAAQNYLTATKLAAESYAQLTDTGVMGLRRFGSRRSWEDRQNRFRLDRTLAFAQAHINLSRSPDFTTNRANRDVCRNQPECITKAIEKLNEAEASQLVSRFQENSDDQRDAMYNHFYFWRGLAHKDRTGATSNDDAIRDFKRILDGPISTLKDQARAELVATANSAANHELESGSPARAITYYEAAIAAAGGTVEAYNGIGKANLSLARNDADVTESRLDYYSRAEAAFSSASGLSIGEAKAIALSELGQAQAEWAGLLTKNPNVIDPNSEDADSLNQRSLASFVDALAVAGNNTDILSRIASAQFENESWADAVTTYRKTIGLQLNYVDWDQPVNTGSLISKMAGNPALNSEKRQMISNEMVSMADAMVEAGATSGANSSEIYRAAGVVDSGNVTAVLNLGKAQHNASPANIAAAESSFQDVLAKTGGRDIDALALPRYSQERAEALYYLSFIKARGGSETDQNATVSYALKAFEVAPAQPAEEKLKYQKHVCLAHIMDGDLSVTENANSGRCLNLPGAEGLLLYGMFGLRNAQYLAPSQATLVRNNTQFVFRQGKTMLELEQEGDEILRPSLDWPGKSATLTPLGDLLEFGRALSISCNGSATDVDLSSQRAAAAESFFDSYKVAACGRN